jgi:16S rRNA G1207 methylase RsmC
MARFEFGIRTTAYVSRKKPPEDEDDDLSPSPPKPASAERLMIERFPVHPAGRILCTSLGRGQLAAELAALPAVGSVTCWFVDTYSAQETREWCDLNSEITQPLEIVAGTDLPEGPFDGIAIPSSHRGEGEFVRDLMQQAAGRLVDGGWLACGVDNPDDRWMHEELRKVFKKVRRDAHHHGVVYLATREGPPKRLRNFQTEYAFRDSGNLVKVVTRPGVFSHRELDLGARALLEAVEVNAGERVLDLGCGSGAVGLALAMRQPNVSLHAIDANTRAVQCTLEGAALNGLANVTAAVTAMGEIPTAGEFDLAVGNPPYHSQFRIAEIFVQAARRGLKSGGRVAMVTRKPEWFDARMRQFFVDIRVQESRKYYVVSGRQRA